MDKCRAFWMSNIFWTFLIWWLCCTSPLSLVRNQTFALPALVALDLGSTNQTEPRQSLFSREAGRRHKIFRSSSDRNSGTHSPELWCELWSSCPGAVAIGVYFGIVMWQGLGVILAVASKPDFLNLPEILWTS